jgi:hypothetical protein
MANKNELTKGIRGKETKKAIEYLLERQVLMETSIGSIKELNDLDERYGVTYKEVVQRAKDAWGLDYADSSDGYLPAGNLIGRRDLIPQDFGRDGWGFVSNNEKELVIDCVAPNNAYFVFKGVAYRKLSETDTIPQGIHMILHGYNLPLMPTGRHYYKNGDFLIHYFGMPFTLSAGSEMQMEIFSSKFAGKYVMELVLLGEVVAKREYLVKSPAEVLRLMKTEHRDHRILPEGEKP